MLFDGDGDGLLRPAELYGGLDWLGVRVLPSEVKELIGGGGNASLSLADFKAMLLVDDDKAGEEELRRAGSVDPADFASLVATEIEAKAVFQGEEETLAKSKDPGGLPPRWAVPRKVMAQFKAKLITAARGERVWSSLGCLSPTKASVWSKPLHAGIAGVDVRGGYRGLKRDLSLRDEEVPLGHFLAASMGEPEVVTLELRDRSVMPLQPSRHLTSVLDRLFPRPRRYHLVWSHPRTRSPLYVWEPVPPSDDYIALGCLATTGEDSLRALPQRLMQPRTELTWLRCRGGWYAWDNRWPTC